ncbi:MAG: hypothetical protein KAU48_12695 [Candidatus Thorarchaeota archaeon]|nr:hypothetical protein [Candidatus Thorarchaeota archaeon]
MKRICTEEIYSNEYANMRADTGIASLTVERVTAIIKGVTKASGNLLGCVIRCDSDISIIDFGLGESSLCRLVTVSSMMSDFARLVDADRNKCKTHFSISKSDRFVICAWEFPMEYGRFQIGAAIKQKRERKSFFGLGRTPSYNIEDLLKNASLDLLQAIESD